MRKISLLFLIAFAALFTKSLAQIPESHTAADILLRLKKLNVLGTVLYVAAHPDDENSRLIAYLAKDRMYRTGYLSMTRGDGGQNLIGDEQGVEMGLIRTQEMLAARRVDGAEQFFSRAFDFGFTKTTDEALTTWGKEKILSDVVWVIRKFQPDVIITRFPEDYRLAGHGQHAASSVLAHEAFFAAADPTKFPAQLSQGVKPWKTKRIYWNTFNFGGAGNFTSDDQLKLDAGGYNMLLGKSYGEIAAESRTQHKSQGAALSRSRGSAVEYFKILAGDSTRTDIMDGVQASWERVEGGSRIQTLVNRLILDYNMTNPTLSVPGLANLYRQLQGLADGYWKTQKMMEVRQLLEACTGLWIEATAPGPYVAQGDSLKLNFTLINRSDSHMDLRSVHVDGFDSLVNQPLVAGKNFFFTKSIRVPQDWPITQPYWLAEGMSPGSFNVSDQTLIGQPQGKPAFELLLHIVIEGQDIPLTKPVQYKFTDPVKGDQYQPLTVLPVFTGHLEPQVLVFGNNDKKEFEALVKKQSSSAMQPDISLSNEKAFGIRPLGSVQHASFQFEAQPGNNAPAGGYVYLLLKGQGKTDSLKDLSTIAYDHIPRIDYFQPARAKMVITEIKTAGKKIGYIEGAGDKVAQALTQMGYELTILKEKDINPSNLKQFDAVITGVRAHNVHPWLAEKYDVLMDYVREGGNYIVQYSQVNRFNPIQYKMGPYPFALSSNRVTDEQAQVTFLLPGHPALNFPNKITDRDFDGWIQERGIYFADKLDSAYQPILSMHDPGEQPQKGSLIVADYGKGKFVYTGLVFFRELPAGVPGAYRLLANLIALNNKRGF